MPMLLAVHELAKRWWLLALRGVLAILFGLFAFAFPGQTLVTLMYIFGFYAVFDGVVAVAAGVRGTSGWLVLHGVLGIAAGIMTFAWPGLTALILLYLIAGWAMVAGVLQIYAAIHLRKQITNEWLLVLGGVLALLLGIAMVMRPGTGAVSIAWLIGAYAVSFGILLVGLSFRLKKHMTHAPAPQAAI